MDTYDTARCPWLLGDLVLSREVIDALDAHALAEYPDESCGLLTGPATDPRRVDRARAFKNLADLYHQRFPEDFPRTAREFYKLNEKQFADAVDEGGRTGQPVKVIYHSHCDVRRQGGAYFSDEDKRVATEDDGTPRTANVVYLVTNVREGVVDDHKLFVFRGGDWVESPLTVA